MKEVDEEREEAALLLRLFDSWLFDMYVFRPSPEKDGEELALLRALRLSCSSLWTLLRDERFFEV